MDQHYIWLFDKSDRRGLWWAFFCSLLIHGLMFAVMATTTVFLPLAGDNSKIDIVWLYPSFLFGGETETPPPVQSAPPEEKTPATSSAETAPQKPTLHEREPVEEPAEAKNQERTPPPPLPSPQQVEAKVAPPMSPEPETEPEMEPEEEPEMTIPAEVPPPKPAEVKPKPAEVKPKPAEAKPKPAEAKSETHEPAVVKAPLPPAEKHPPAKKEIEAKNGPPVEKVEPPKGEKPATAPETNRPPAVVPPAPPRPAPQQGEKNHEPVPQAVAKNIAPPSQLPPVAPRTTATTPPAAPQALPVPGVSGGERKAITEKRNEPPPSSKPVPVQKPVQKPAEKVPTQPSGPKGIFAPPLAGDLKLEITGSEEALKAVKISVMFREYPKTRHSRPMTRAVARNSQVITPKMTRVAKNTLQAVIEVAGEGVYDFNSQSDSASRSEATFSVKIYENSGRTKTKSAGTRKVGNKGSIVKVLMPEGIIWDDESAFSGSMEDSESITRFNTDTGLVWKEYKD